VIEPIGTDERDRFNKRVRDRTLDRCPLKLITRWRTWQAVASSPELQRLHVRFRLRLDIRGPAQLTETARTIKKWVLLAALSRNNLTDKDAVGRLLQPVGHAAIKGGSGTHKHRRAGSQFCPAAKRKPVGVAPQHASETSCQLIVFLANDIHAEQACGKYRGVRLPGGVDTYK
jgi:hypothetical protein